MPGPGVIVTERGVERGFWLPAELSSLVGRGPQITAILDRYLPALTPQAQVRELRRLLYDLEELREAYHDIAITENDPEAANVSVRTAHEIAQLRMFVGGGQHSDPIQLTQQVGPRSRESSMAALQRGLDHLCGKPVNPPEVSAPVPDQGDRPARPPQEEPQL